MAYWPAPGTSTSSSLPAKPPAASGNRPALQHAFGASVTPPGTGRNSSQAYSAPPGSYAGFLSASTPAPVSYIPPGQHGSRGPNRTLSGQYGPSSQYASSSHAAYQHTTAAPGMSSAATKYPQPGHPPQPASQANQSHSQQSYAAPQIQNPFPLPGTSDENFDPSEAAQIAAWQSAYSTNTSLGKDGKPAVTKIPKIESPVVSVEADKKKTVVRQGGGKKWTDESLLEWDPTHLRLFVGNLAGETTDESLQKAFARWKSVQKAHVIRDKRTSKSKGYGFVSFSDADDFFQAAKEMNGKYIQSHPVVVKKANTEIKVTNVKEKNRFGKNGKNDASKKSGNHGGGGSGYEASSGATGGAGIMKPGQRTKNGLRLLG